MTDHAATDDGLPMEVSPHQVVAALRAEELLEEVLLTVSGILQQALTGKVSVGLQLEQLRAVVKYATDRLATLRKQKAAGEQGKAG